MFRKAAIWTARVACFTEGIIAVKYYLFVGLPKKGEVTNRFRMLEGHGEYVEAPFWEPEVGAIRMNTNMPEFTLCHEVGHSRQPWRLAYMLCFGIVNLPVESFAIPVAISWLTLWFCLAAAERHADYWALQRCSLAGLQEAGVYFQKEALKTNWTYFFPVPDTHFASSTRAFMVHERILQLQANPTALPNDVPMPKFKWELNEILN